MYNLCICKNLIFPYIYYVYAVSAHITYASAFSVYPLNKRIHLNILCFCKHRILKICVSIYGCINKHDIFICMICVSIYSIICVSMYRLYQYGCM